MKLSPDFEKFLSFIPEILSRDESFLKDLESCTRGVTIRKGDYLIRTGELCVDASPEDFAVLLIANAGLIHRTVDDAPRSSARLVAVWLAGVLPHDMVDVPPAPTETQVRRALGDPGGARPR